MKKKGPGTSDHRSSGCKKNSFISDYYLTDEVWWFNIKWFLSYYKTSANLCKPIYHIVNCSTVTYLFESGKCGKEGKKLQLF